MPMDLAGQRACCTVQRFNPMYTSPHDGCKRNFPKGREGWWWWWGGGGGLNFTTPKQYQLT